MISAGAAGYLARGTGLLKGAGLSIVTAPAVPTRINLVVMGTDERSGDAGRSDTLMFVSLAPRRGEAAVISIPRDTRVRLPGENRYDRVNTAFGHGGPELVVKTVEEFLGVPVDYYVKTDFSGFERIVDSLGGVEIEVEKRMKYRDRAQELVIDLQPGKQVLNGNQALGYVRFRNDRFGDVTMVDPSSDTYGGRIERQHKFLKALARRILQPGTLPKLPALTRELASAVETDIPLDLMLKLVFYVSRISESTIHAGVVPGTPQRIDGKSYWVPEEDGARRVLQALVTGSGQPAEVVVLNGSGSEGAADRAARVLRKSGLNVVAIGNADHFDYRATQVIPGSARSDASLLVEAISRELGAKGGQRVDGEQAAERQAGSDQPGEEQAGGKRTGNRGYWTGEANPGDAGEGDGYEATASGHQGIQADITVILGEDLRI